MEETKLNGLEECIKCTVGNEEKIFIFPPVGPNLYWEVREKIFQKGLTIPDGEDVAHLLHVLYCDSRLNEMSERYKAVFKNKGGVYVFNRNIWTPQGDYVIRDSDVDDLKNGMEPERVSVWGLMQLIEGGEGREGVRFVPKESCTMGEVDHKSIADSGFVIANFGKQGAKNLSEVAACFSNKPFLYSMDLDEEFYGYHSPLDYKMKVASISTENDRLNIYGVRDNGANCRGDLKTSAFGMLTKTL